MKSKKNNFLPKNIKPCVIGLGYVGLPVFLKLSKMFLSVGFDINKKRIKYLKEGLDYNKEYKKKDFRFKKKSFFTHKEKDIKDCNFYIVTVPTPIFKNKRPNLSLIKKAFNILKKYINPGDIVFLESTVYPGTTENICVPILSSLNNLKFRKDFNVGYSSERINPGDKKHTLDKIKKVVAFKEINSLEKKKVLKVYKLVSKKIIYSNCIKDAELSKLLENTQRDLNIAFINEIKILCNKLKLNFNEVYRLASSKWNFLKFQPGLVGGHCLPVDPYYLSFIGKKFGFKTKVTLSGRTTNEKMITFYIDQIKQKFKKLNLKKNDKILIAGLTYKQNTSDLRNSLAIKIYKNLKKIYKKIDGFDPNIFIDDAKKLKLKTELSNITNYRCVVFLVNHFHFIKLKKRLKKSNISFFNI